MGVQLRLETLQLALQILLLLGEPQIPIGLAAQGAPGCRGAQRLQRLMALENRLPQTPIYGTHALKAVDGVLTFVADS